jgi:hypothetical protein
MIILLGEWELLRQACSCILSSVFNLTVCFCVFKKHLKNIFLQYFLVFLDYFSILILKIKNLFLNKK